MSKIPSSCDYLIVGGGATGMAFADSLLNGEKGLKPSVVMVDQHSAPGGQWNDSYGFVQLHQPSAMYGVETVPLEPNESAIHRATRQEILDYYQSVADKLTLEYEFCFVGKATLDLDQEPKDKSIYTFQVGEETREIQVKRRLVDARYLQPDLPIEVPPKFGFDKSKIHCIPVNSVQQSTYDYFVIIGAGKTGMDAVYYLLTQTKTPPANIVWVMPHQPWITARENIGSCLQFLQTVATVPDLDLQEAFQRWELEGKIYRLLDTNDVPTKFKDATLSKEELSILRTIPESNIILGKGRVLAIQDNGKLVLQNDEGTNKTVLDLPFDSTVEVQDIAYVHCSAGAFNYTKQIGTKPIPIFDQNRITIQDVYGTPGFCFVGSILGKLESIPHLTDDQRNAMCLTPGPSQEPDSKLGFTTGDIGYLSPDHGYVQRLLNLRKWLQVDEIREWLIGHRLFNLGHYPSPEAIEVMLEETYAILKAKDIVED